METERLITERERKNNGWEIERERQIDKERETTVDQSACHWFAYFRVLGEIKRKREREKERERERDI